MSHGRRMLEAQAQKERTSGTCEDGRLDDGHLRNGSRALNDDGTPVRLSRGGARTSGDDRGRDDGHDDVALVSPPPRPSVRLGFNRAGDGSRSASSVATAAGSALGATVAETANRQQRISGIGPSPAAPFSCARLAVPRRLQSSDVAEGVRVSAARHIDVDAEEGENDDNARKTRGTLAEAAARGSPRRKGGGGRDDLLAGGDSAQRRISSEARSRSRSRTGGSGYSSASGLRYPVSRVNALAATATLSAAPHDLPSPLNQGRTGSRSPPPMTAVQKTSASTSLFRQPRATPLPAPITAAVLRPSNTESRASPTLDTGTATAVTHAARQPPSLRQESSSRSAGGPGFTTAMASSAKTPPLQMLISPASPPLRAGVSPRMLPLHPTRADASSASMFLSRAASASTVTTTVATTPSSSQAQLPPPVGSQVSPYELQQHQPYPMPPTPSSTAAAVMPSRSVVHHDFGDLAGDAVGEDRAATEAEPHTLLRSTKPRSQKSEPTVATAGSEWQSAPPSPLPTSAELLARPRLPLLPEATLPYDEVGITPLTNSADRRIYPFMRDFSGFHNTGNDCYGCSLLTMLLRSEVFRRALLGSPLVCAMRRYEALLTGKAERRVLWTSGYVNTAAETKAKKTAARKRTRPAGWPADDGDDGGQTEEASVTGACGLPDTTPRVPAETLAHSQYVWRPTADVQHTLDVLDTFSLSELEDALEVDLETQRVPATLHGALAALARAQRWREHMTTLVNMPRMQAAERQRLLETKIYHDNDRDFDGQVYTHGIRLNAVANLFDGEFFLGDQEDAHELFVSVMAKLETEAVKFQHHCDEVLERRSSVTPTERSSAEDEVDEEAEPEEGRPNNEGGASFAEKRLLRGAHAPSAFSMRPSDVPAAASPSKPHRLSVSTTAGEVWINTLVQTRLLNIIRCRTAECHHEIVTDEVCVNLSVHIPEEPLTSPPPALPLPPQSCFPAQPPPLSPTPIFPSSSIAAAVAAPLPAMDGGGGRCRSLANLLHESMAYEALNEYRCDCCGSRTSQFQGGCFYTRPPPLLVLQLKRFATQFVNGTIIIQKNGRRVAVEDKLVIHALPSAGEWHAGQRRRGRQHRRSPDPVEPVEVTEAVEDAREGAECCPYYDPDKKCFSAALQEICDVSGGGGLAGRDGLKDEKHDSTGDGLLTTLAAAAPPSSLVRAIRCLYRLRSCVLHLGQSLHYGHYVSDFAVDGEEDDEEDGEDGETARARRTAEQEAGVGSTSQATLNSCSAVRRRWRRANDERVEVLSDEVVQARRAGCSDTYLLLYEKVAEERVWCPAEAVLPTPVYRSSEGGKT
ncbi:cysteine_peptidase_-_Clan_CA_-_family_C19_-_putative [Leishmania infantum]|uniref:ubiquitinyl hydrolase 1 n=2 Tax=Leishmania infantum TaxID=5671 RepID=A0A6L0X381_LEIIN|nr:cysteine_peptidase_-_Clan_CA_-_family_C19_-_putative [Leishmania infantum]SUZ40883.1 cysteine_peptidase_-_Clan_CA_-_family_C19_-_putative [Leishmania infantum]